MISSPTKKRLEATVNYLRSGETATNPSLGRVWVGINNDIFTHNKGGLKPPLLWVKMDSNHRSRETADLQSAPFGHSGIHPRYGMQAYSAMRAMYFSASIPSCELGYLSFIIL